MEWRVIDNLMVRKMQEDASARYAAVVQGYPTFRQNMVVAHGSTAEEADEEGVMYWRIVLEYEGILRIVRVEDVVIE